MLIRISITETFKCMKKGYRPNPSEAHNESTTESSVLYEEVNISKYLVSLLRNKMYIIRLLDSVERSFSTDEEVPGSIPGSVIKFIIVPQHVRIVVSVLHCLLSISCRCCFRRRPLNSPDHSSGEASVSFSVHICYP